MIAGPAVHHVISNTLTSTVIWDELHYYYLSENLNDLYAARISMPHGRRGRCLTPLE